MSTSTSKRLLFDIRLEAGLKLVAAAGYGIPTQWSADGLKLAAPGRNSRAIGRGFDGSGEKRLSLVKSGC